MLHCLLPVCVCVCVCMCAYVLGAAVCGAQFSGGEKTDEGTELG